MHMVMCLIIFGFGQPLTIKKEKMPFRTLFLPIISPQHVSSQHTTTGMKIDLVRAFETLAETNVDLVVWHLIII